MGKGPKKVGWQARVQRLLVEDTTKSEEKEKEKNAAKAKRKRGEDPAKAEDWEEEQGGEEQVAKRRKEMYSTESKESQLFVGNIPFDATEEEITERFGTFGKVQRVLFVRDKITRRPTGAAFIHFKMPTGVDKALKECATQAELMRMEGGGAKAQHEMTRKQQKRDIFKGRTDGGAHIEGILFNGRLLSVKAVVSRKEAANKTRQAEREKEKEEHSDPRNLKLLEEGRVMRGTPAAAGLGEKRLDLLNNRHQLKKKKLKDPNFFVSPTRLSIRDLPPSVDEKQLKAVIVTAIKAYTAQHPEIKVEKGTKKNPFIKMLRIVKDVSTDTSRGFGFAEFKDQDIALAVLRDLNNNPYHFAGKRLDVEFAVESVHALQKLKRITDKGKERNKFVLEKAREGADGNESWRELQEAAAAKKEKEKAKKKRDFEKYKKYVKYSGRKN
eukprot:TRINITY_DN1059_c0_g4_i2.p1 TRINITY_DN1059_c0_g4~~TRINITY_DN1059_c0_g4_i2.p1  ORF type:complete len:440 (+),score=168.17 TRINITY_DN1059_c0_g4_i2:31-1350(+)